MAGQYINEQGLMTLIAQIKANQSKTYKVKGSAIYADAAYLADPNKHQAIDSTGLWQLVDGTWTKITVFEVGWVYNIENKFTTDADFIEGADETVGAGSNIVVAETSGTPVTYKWDRLASMFDLDDVQEKQLTNALTMFTALDGTAVEYASHDLLPASESKATATIATNSFAVMTGNAEYGDVYRATVTENAQDATRNDIAWIKVGNQTTVEGALELLSKTCPVKPISDADIIAMFNS